MSNKHVGIFGTLSGVALFIIAITVLHHELRAIHYHQITAAMGAIPYRALFVASAFTAFNFFALGAYEFLGFRYIHTSLPWYKILLASTAAFSFSNNVGFYSISGSAVRFRLYSQWGLSALDITKLIVFSSGITFWLGLCSISAVVFLSEPLALPSALHLPHSSPYVLGAFFLLAVLVFIFAALVIKKPITVRAWKFDIPSIWLTIGLIVFSCIDWMLFGAVLYVLLPFTGMSYWAFLGIFLLAQLAGLASHVPGGVGVFETVFVLLLRNVSAPEIMGALVLFRLIYYLAPLSVSILLLGGYELYQRRKKIGDFALVMGQWGSGITGIVPYFFSLMTFIGGMILLFSGSTPAEHHRMHWLTHIMPLPVLEISHFLASLFGVMLLLLSRGIYRRFDSAWHLTLYMFAGGALFTFLKGIDYEEAIILLVMFLILLPSRREFFRKGSFVSDRYTPGWVAVIGLALASSLWLGFFAYKHVAYSNELWWQFSLHGHASRFLRANVGAMALLLGFSLYRLLSPGRLRFAASTPVDESVVRRIVEVFSNKSNAHLAFLGDKSFLVSEHSDAFIMYGHSGRSWVAMGDPVGDEKTFRTLVWQYKELCDKHGGWPVFYEVSKRDLGLYVEIGLTLLKMGEEACVELRKFSLEGSHRKGLRNVMNKLSQEGWEFEVIAQENVPPLLPTFRAISDSWLNARNTREKRFSLGNFNEAYLQRTPIGLVRQHDEIVAFANIWLTATKEEVSIDLMRYSEHAPKSVMDFLFLNLLFWGKAQGFHWFNLGMAPFSGMEDRQLAPLWNRLSAFIYKHGEDFYNFQGLRQYKDKFDPLWEPRYMAVPGGLTLPLILKDVSSLISGGLKGVFTK